MEVRMGYFMVDVSICCFQVIGWVNFWMWVMFVIFVSYVLWFDWWLVVYFFVQFFLDFELGIYYFQIQMQVGLIGYYIFCIFNFNVQVI